MGAGIIPYDIPYEENPDNYCRRASRPASEPRGKTRITRAADLRGVPLSAFVRDAVLREAEHVMTAELTVTLSVEEPRRFLKALDTSFQPNAKLKKAMERGLTRR